MSVRFIKRPIERLFASIKTKTGPWLLQTIDKVVFIRHEVECAGLPLIRDDEVKQCVQLRFFLSESDLCNRLAVKFLQFWIFDSGNHDARAAAAIKENVLPPGMVGRHLLLNLGARHGLV